MLQGINRIGQSWIGRVIVAILFGFLIVSFAVWGIGDIFRGGTRTQVATVGGQDITADTYRNAYQSEYQQLIRRSGRSITPDQARALGLEDRVLQRLISEAAFDREARNKGLTVSDQMVIQAIQADPNFRGAGGTFDRSLFNDLLRQSGMTETQYVREQRFVMARQQMAEALTGSLRIPLTMREAVHRYQAERRNAEFLRLGPAQAGEIAAAADDKLAAFYEERKISFRAPEYRTANLLSINPTTLAKPDAVTDQEARDYYAKVGDERFGAPERRTIQQILFPTKEAAIAASDKIKAGTAFEAIAKELGIDDATLNLGTMTRGDMLDPVTADAAFTLPEGGVSEPLDGRFGATLVRVSKIQPAAMKPFDEVAAEVKLEIAKERARAELQTVHDAIEDQRAGAKPLADIAKERKLPLTQISTFDRAGRDKAGQPVAALTGQTALLTGLFRADIGSDNEAVTTPDGGYIWFEVTNIEGARDRPLAEIRDQVAADWRKAEIGRVLAEKATALVARLDKGEALSAIATEIGSRAETAGDIARGQAKDGLPATVVARLFATPVGKAGSATQDEENRVLFRVTSATVPVFVISTQEAAGAERQLQTLLVDDLLAEYLADVEKRIGVTIYRNNIRRAIGGDS